MQSPASPPSGRRGAPTMLAPRLAASSKWPHTSGHCLTKLPRTDLGIQPAPTPETLPALDSTLRHMWGADSRETFRSESTWGGEDSPTVHAQAYRLIKDD